MRRVAAEAGEQTAEMRGVDPRGGGEIAQGRERGVTLFDDVERALQGGVGPRAVSAAGARPLAAFQQEQPQVADGHLVAQGAFTTRLAKQLLQQISEALGVRDDAAEGRRDLEAAHQLLAFAPEEIDEVFLQGPPRIADNEMRHAGAVGEEVSGAQARLLARETQGAGAVRDKLPDVGPVARALHPILGEAAFESGAGNGERTGRPRLHVEAGVARVGDLRGERRQRR